MKLKKKKICPGFTICLLLLRFWSPLATPSPNNTYSIFYRGATHRFSFLTVKRSHFTASHAQRHFTCPELTCIAGNNRTPQILREWNCSYCNRYARSTLWDLCILSPHKKRLLRLTFTILRQATPVETDQKGEYEHTKLSL